MKKNEKFLGFVFLALICFILPDLYANQRHFTYTYETATLPEGETELEFWHTDRIGRDKFYHAVDQRLEFEWGITDNLQVAWYLNFSAEQKDDGTASYVNKNKLFGTSLEAKYKLLDPVADPVGLALYGEITSKPHEFEFESKLLLDKRINDFVTALNVVYERELLFVKAKNEIEDIIELDFGFSYFISDHLTAGLEIRSHNEIIDGKYEHSALFAGPTFSYGADNWWGAISLAPTITDLKNHSYRYHEHEKLESRILIGFHF